MRSSGEGLGINPAAPTVLFLDLNAAFASIEQQHRPELRGRPVAVCPGAVRASTVISASREARALGVRTIMRVYEALRICPDLVLLEPNAARYREVSERLLRLLDSYSPRVLPLSIDEAAVDLAGTPSLRRDLLDVGREVKRRLRDEVGDWLTCSIGFSTNIFLAKQAAELEKPDGLQLIDHRNLEDVLSRLRLTDLTGVSEANATRMRRAGIITPVHLLQASRHTLRRQVFGSIVGEAWYLRLRGYETESFEEAARKSVSHSHVLPRPVSDPGEVRALMLRFCDRLGRRLRQEGQGLFGLACELWERMGEGRPIRAMGIALSELSTAAVSQLDLFAAEESRSERVSALQDRLRDRFGERAVVAARLLNRGDLAPDRIAFGKLPPVGGRRV
ncbi:MAG: DNA polymerase IV [Chloroflexi bacterium]|nr:MAG: DNA polymerase IV [Chloroflexota bacterium]